MADRRDGPRGPARAPLRSRGRRRWVVLIGVTGMWLLLLRGTKASVTVATAMLLVLATAIGLALMALRWLGVDRDHPWVQRIGERPWRDGREVLQLALRHLPEVFIMTPSGSLLAPNALEVLDELVRLRLSHRGHGSEPDRLVGVRGVPEAASVSTRPVSAAMARSWCGSPATRTSWPAAIASARGAWWAARTR